ncbi:serine/threonine-protein kinase [Hyphomonas sp.]|uniref:protein kinase domain-containing protein n=1 Tax=Hyphomonas sp. TaxID=87 RepID=UPI0025C51BFD|nr:serine/threonine-protein kinase [Hyphomonas sp.]
MTDDRDVPPTRTGHHAGEAASDVQPDWRFPAFLNDEYEDVRPLTSAGQAAIYRVRRRRDGADRVLKIYHSADAPDPEVLESLGRINPEFAVVGLTRFRPAQGGQLATRYEEMEFVGGGSLQDLLHIRNAPFSSDEVRSLLRRLVQAVKLIDEAGIIHRDIKPGNILLPDGQLVRARLSDFGISSAVRNTVKITSVSGTALYSAPEASFGSPARQKTDLWSVGMIILEMLLGDHPFAGMPPQAISAYLFGEGAGDLPDRVSDSNWRILLRGLLRRRYQDRFSVGDVETWLDNPAHSSLERAPEQGGHVRPLRFLGQNCFTPADLGRLMSEEWDNAITARGLVFPEILSWLMNQLGDTDLASELRRLDAQSGVSQHVVHFSMICALAPDLPLVFRGQSLTPQAFMAAAGDALTDGGARAPWLQEVFGQRIIDIAAQLPRADQSFYRNIRARSDEISAGYHEARTRIRSQMDPEVLAHLPEVTPAALSRIHATAILSVQSAGRMERSMRSFSSNALCADWFRNLVAEAVSSPAAALLAADAEPAASAEAEQVTNLVWRRFASCVSAGAAYATTALITSTVFSVFANLYCDSAAGCTNIGWNAMSLPSGVLTALLAAATIGPIGVLYISLKVRRVRP